MSNRASPPSPGKFCGRGLSAGGPTAMATIKLAQRAKLELFYDVVSPYTHFSLHNWTRYCKLWKLDVVMRPMFLGGVPENPNARVGCCSCMASSAPTTPRASRRACIYRCDDGH